MAKILYLPLFGKIYQRYNYDENCEFFPLLFLCRWLQDYMPLNGLIGNGLIDNGLVE